jgi:hypothetical protein
MVLIYQGCQEGRSDDHLLSAPISLVKSVREDRLGAIRYVVWGLLFEVAGCVVVALA